MKMVIDYCRIGFDDARANYDEGKLEAAVVLGDTGKAGDVTKDGKGYKIWFEYPKFADEDVTFADDVPYEGEDLLAAVTAGVKLNICNKRARDRFRKAGLGGVKVRADLLQALILSGDADKVAEFQRVPADQRQEWLVRNVR